MAPVVLCIDKREGNLKAECCMLRLGGYETLAASTCDEAVELLSQQQVDVLLISDDLPPDEFRNCARLRQFAGSASIVLQRSSFDRAVAPPEADIVLPKTTHPREKLRIIGSLLVRQAA